MTYGVTLGIAFASDMVTMYFFYELLTLSTIPLVMHAMHKKAVAAGIKYALYSIAGAALAFVGLVFLIVHDANDFVLGGHFAQYSGNMTVLLTVFSVAFVGCGVKAAIWPFHSWLPSAAVAPTPVTALLHAVAVVKAGAFACIRLVYYAFGAEILRGTWGQYVVMCLAIITLVFGSAMSLKQTHFKWRLAYSTVSNLSYILFACALMTPAGMVAAWVHLIVHSVVKIMAFFCAGSVLHYAHREYVHELEGLGRRMPLTFAAFTVAACALTGVPPFNGFVSKWYIALAATGEGSVWAVLGFVGLLISALLTAIYMFQVVIKAWFPAKDAPAIAAGSAHEAGPMMTVPILILAALCLLMGLFPNGLLSIIREAVML
jgi:multicomponent Na+:H+ antiporter subunit D